MNTQQLLLKCVDIINERGWCKGTYYHENGEVCVIGALQIALSQCEYNESIEYEAEELLKSYTDRLGFISVASYNDWPLTKKENIINMLHICAELAA